MDIHSPLKGQVSCSTDQFHAWYLYGLVHLTIEEILLHLKIHCELFLQRQNLGLCTFLGLCKSSKPSGVEPTPKSDTPALELADGKLGGGDMGHGNHFNFIKMKALGINCF